MKRTGKYVCMSVCCIGYWRDEKEIGRLMGRSESG